MKTTVRSLSTGTIFEVDEKFNNYQTIRSEIIALGKNWHTYWWVKDDEVTATVDGSKTEFVVETMSAEMEEYVETIRKQRIEEKEQEEVNRRSQMYNY